MLWTDPKRLELQELAPQLNFLCSKRERSPRSAGAGTEPHIPSHPLNPGATEAELPTVPILPTLPPELQLATRSECYVFPKGHSWVRDGNTAANTTFCVVRRLNHVWFGFPVSKMLVWSGKNHTQLLGTVLEDFCVIFQQFI